MQLSEEEKKGIKDSVLAVKAEAVKDYSNKDFVNALNKFSLCIKNSEQIEQDEKELMAILHCNRGLCFTKTVKKNKHLISLINAFYISIKIIFTMLND